MFIDKNSRRFNPSAIIKHDGVIYNGNVMMFPGVCAELGITEIADPQPPVDYNEKFWFRTEQDEAPYVVFTKRSEEQIARILADEAKSVAQRHLNETDYLFTVDKYAQLSDERRAELTASREAARQVIRDWEEAYEVQP